MCVALVLGAIAAPLAVARAETGEERVHIRGGSVLHPGIDFQAPVPLDSNRGMVFNVPGTQTTVRRWAVVEVLKLSGLTESVTWEKFQDIVQSVAFAPPGTTNDWYRLRAEAHRDTSARGMAANYETEFYEQRSAGMGMKHAWRWKERGRFIIDPRHPGEVYRILVQTAYYQGFLAKDAPILPPSLGSDATTERFITSFRFEALDTVVRTSPVLGNHVIAVRLAEGALWATSSDPGEVLKLDPTTLAVLARVPVGRGPTDLAFEGGALWVVLENDDAVVRLDPTTLAVTHRVKVGKGPIVMDAAGGTLWITNTRAGTLTRVDASSRLANKTVRAGKEPIGVTVHQGVVWVADWQSSALLRFDAATAKPVGSPLSVPGRPQTLAVCGDALWVACDDGAVHRVDPATATLVATVRTGPDAAHVACGEGAVWVCSLNDGFLRRIDPQTNQVVGPARRVGAMLKRITTAAGTVYVSDGLHGYVARLEP